MTGITNINTININNPAFTSWCHIPNSIEPIMIKPKSTRTRLTDSITHHYHQTHDPPLHHLHALSHFLPRPHTYPLPLLALSTQSPASLSLSWTTAPPTSFHSQTNSFSSLASATIRTHHQ